MNDDLYADPEVCQAILQDYHRTPRCHGTCDPATHTAEARNPACGDIVKLSFQLAGSHIQQARTTGAGCAISQASASLLVEQLQGKTLTEARTLLQELGHLLAQQTCNPTPLGPLLALRLITGNPARVHCAGIARQAALQALG